MCRRRKHMGTLVIVAVYWVVLIILVAIVFGAVIPMIKEMCHA
jgi:hypothetical protein